MRLPRLSASTTWGPETGMSSTSCAHGMSAFHVGHVLDPRIHTVRPSGSVTLLLWGRDQARLDAAQARIEKIVAGKLGSFYEQVVLVDQPSVEDTISILRGLRERYEVHHGVSIRDAALVAAATLSNRYITERFLPDKAIDLVDEAASKIKMEIDSLPIPIDEVERKLVKLQIEELALKRESDKASKARLDELRREIAAQLDAFESTLGQTPDYLDGHQHVHQFPRVRDALMEEMSLRYPGRQPWLRSTKRGTAGFKPALIQALGQHGLARRAALLGFRQNRRLLGVYDFDPRADYRRLMRGWLAALPDGALLFTTTDADGALPSATVLANLELQASDTLTNWITLTNGLSLTNGVLQVRDADATNHPARYYRLVEH